MDKVLFIIGCAKCGTTSMANWLGQRDDMVSGVRKEPCFFTDFANRSWRGPGADTFESIMIRDMDSYSAYYADADADTWCVDASTDYLWSEGTAERIEAFSRNREVRLLCITRDPVARAVSEYNHTLRHEWETLSFGDSLKAENQRRADNWIPLFYHKRRSLIADDISHYSGIFGDKMMVLDFSALRTPDRVLGQVAQFMGVPEQPLQVQNVLNTSRLPRNALAARMKDSKLLRAVGRRIAGRNTRRAVWQALHTESGRVMTVSPAEKDRLRQELAEEIAKCVAHPLIPTDTWAGITETA